MESVPLSLNPIAQATGIIHIAFSRLAERCRSHGRASSDDGFRISMAARTVTATTNAPSLDPDGNRIEITE